MGASVSGYPFCSSPEFCLSFHHLADYPLIEELITHNPTLTPTPRGYTSISYRPHFPEAHILAKNSGIGYPPVQQSVLFQGQLIEEWRFEFGFVIPGSTNTWQQTIEAAEDVMPPELLDNNVEIVTSFYDGPLFVCQSRLRVRYE